MVLLGSFGTCQQQHGNHVCCQSVIQLIQRLPDGTQFFLGSTTLVRLFAIPGPKDVSLILPRDQAIRQPCPQGLQSCRHRSGQAFQG